MPQGGAVVPGFVDPHTHVVFAGDRRDELRRRLGRRDLRRDRRRRRRHRQHGAGHPRRDRRRDCRGDRRTPRRDAAMRHDDLRGEKRLRVDAPSRSSRCCAWCGDSDCEQPIELSPTFMGAHEIPIEYRDRRRAYVDLVIHEMIPAVAAEGWRSGATSSAKMASSRRTSRAKILRAGMRRGPEAADPRRRARPERRIARRRRPRVRSADHLIFVDKPGADGLAAAGAVATLLPIAVVLPEARALRARRAC